MLLSPQLARPPARRTFFTGLTAAKPAVGCVLRSTTSVVSSPVFHERWTGFPSAATVALRVVGPGVGALPLGAACARPTPASIAIDVQMTSASFDRRRVPTYPPPWPGPASGSRRR